MSIDKSSTASSSSGPSSRYQVLLCSTESQLAACQDIRIAVFCDEQGFTLDLEIDEHDRTAAHFILIDAEDSNKPIGTLRWLPYPYPQVDLTQPNTMGKPLSVEQINEMFWKTGDAKLGRLALLKEARGKGLGAKIVKESEEWLKGIFKGGPTTQAQIESSQSKIQLRLHSQMPVIPFYERLGYSQSGEQFDEDGAPHMLCVKSV
ncbi:unnamed protein product [Sympodiomycopsis kandeliae]